MDKQDKKYKNQYVNVNQQLIKHIYSTVDLSKFKFELIQYSNELTKLLKQKYYVSVNFMGHNSLLVFCKIRDKYHTFTVNRNTLSFKESTVDYEKVRLYYRRLGLEPAIYNGTIFDGTLIENRNGNDTFIISDVYTFCGSNYSHLNMEMKMKSVTEYLDNNYDPNDSKNNLNIRINKLYSMSETEHVITKKIPNITQYKAKGIAFYPELSGIKLLFLFGNETRTSSTVPIVHNPTPSHTPHTYSSFTPSQKLPSTQFKKESPSSRPLRPTVSPISKKMSDSASDSKKNNSLKYVNKTDSDVYASLEMKTTDNIDVYKLFAMKQVTSDKNDGRSFKKKIKMGYAHIGSIEKSLQYRKLFKDGNTKIMMYCKFNNTMHKWEPIREDKDKKIPTDCYEIEKYLELIEMSDED